MGFWETFFTLTFAVLGAWLFMGVLLIVVGVMFKWFRTRS